MADEVTDSSNRELVFICFRWVDKDLETHEYFIGLYKVEFVTSNEQVAVLNLRHDVSINSCRGQCYDGASNTSGKYNGVATQIPSEESRAIFTHCYVPCAEPSSG